MRDTPSSETFALPVSETGAFSIKRIKKTTRSRTGTSATKLLLSSGVVQAHGAPRSYVAYVWLASPSTMCGGAKRRRVPRVVCCRLCRACVRAFGERYIHRRSPCYSSLCLTQTNARMHTNFLFFVSLSLSLFLSRLSLSLSFSPPISNFSTSRGAHTTRAHRGTHAARTHKALTRDASIRAHTRLAHTRTHAARTYAHTRSAHMKRLLLSLSLSVSLSPPLSLSLSLSTHHGGAPLKALIARVLRPHCKESERSIVGTHFEIIHVWHTLRNVIVLPYGGTYYLDIQGGI
jgi:hypothetical protein